MTYIHPITERTAPETIRVKHAVIGLILLVALADSVALYSLKIAYGNREISPLFFVVTMALLLFLGRKLVEYVRVKFGAMRVVLLLELAILYFVMTPSSIIFTYVSFGFSKFFPYRDELLLQIDQALGYHWESFAQMVAHTPYAPTVLLYAYASLRFQFFIMVAYLVWSRDFKKLYGVFFIFIVSVMLCCLLCLFVPATSVFAQTHFDDSSLQYFSLGAGHKEVMVMDALRRGAFAEFTRENITGIVTFPSFHAVLALMMIWVFADQRFLRMLAIPVNVLMLVSALYIGGHYLVDVLAGIFVGMVSIAIVERVGAR